MEGNTALLLLELVGIIFLFAAIFAVRSIVKDQPSRDDAAKQVKS
jgi:hypothetical protein